ncbi:MAG: hypothetical protein RIQ60_562 [Pseudomonadota bacterium]|jgi:PAS domain S-box-containing protein
MIDAALLSAISTFIVDSSDRAILICDAQLEVLYTNPRCAELFGQECRGLRLSQIPVQLAWSQQAFTLADCLQAKGLVAQFEAPDQHLVQIHVTAKRLELPTGVYHSLLIADYGYEASLSEYIALGAEALRNMTFDLSGIQFALDQHSIVSIADVAGNITHANEKFCEVSGYSLDELRGRNHRLLKSGLHPKSLYEDLWATISAGKVWKGELANRKKNGELYWVNSTIVPWMDSHGIPIKYISIRSLITDRVNAEISLKNAYKQELELTGLIQKALLASDKTTSPGLDVSVYNIASQTVNGDFFSFINYSDACSELLIGDVMGKGLKAGMVAAGVKSEYFKAISSALIQDSSSIPSPATIMKQLGQGVSRNLLELDTFVTCLLVRVDRSAMQISWVNAGHLPGMLATSGHSDVVYLEGENLPFGVLLDEDYVEFSRSLAVNDKVIVYTDGVTESASAQGEQYGLERLAQLLQRTQAKLVPPSMCQHALQADLEAFCSSDAMSDDRTAIIMHVQGQSKLDTPTGSGGSLSFALEPGAIDLMAVQRRIQGFFYTLDQLALAELTGAVLRCLSSLPVHDRKMDRSLPISFVATQDANAAQLEITFMPIDGAESRGQRGASHAVDPMAQSRVDLNSEGRVGVQCQYRREALPGLDSWFISCPLSTGSTFEEAT